MGYRFDQHTSDWEARLSSKHGNLYTPLSSCHSTRGSWRNTNSPLRARVSKRGKNRLLRLDMLKKIHIHNKGGRVADLSAMMKITRPCGKCWDVPCLLYATGFLSPLVNFAWNPLLSVSLSCLIFLSISHSLFLSESFHHHCLWTEIKKNKSSIERPTCVCLCLNNSWLSLSSNEAMCCI